MDALEVVLGVATAALGTIMIVTWTARTAASEAVRVSVSAGQSPLAQAKKRRVRQLDHALVELGLAFVLAAVGYVVLGVMPA